MCGERAVGECTGGALEADGVCGSRNEVRGLNRSSSPFENWWLSLEGNLERRWRTSSRGSSFGQGGGNVATSNELKVGECTRGEVVHRMNTGGADMGKGEQLNISVEMPSSKVHGSDFRTSARQKRFIYITLFAVLLPLVIMRSYFFHTSSDVLSEVTEFVVMQPEASSNVTSTGDSMESPILSETRDLRSRNSPANSTLAVNSSLEHSTQETEELTKEENTGGIVMEGRTETPYAAQNSSDGLMSGGVCNLEQGKWIPDSHPPLYNNATCKYIQGHQNCHNNGRPDDGYLYWKWKPDQCELPRLDAAAFLNAMRYRTVVFAGDSLARNQFQSLLCVLSQVEDPKHTYWSKDGKNNVYYFQSFNFTLTARWSPYLVRIEEKMVTWADNTTENVRHVYLDEPDEEWVQAAVGADILQLSTGQWWFQRARYLEKNISLGCHGHPHCHKHIGFPDPYIRALANVFRGSLAIPGFNGTIVYRSFSPEHFENGNWDTGGVCSRTAPGGVPMSYDTDQMYGRQKKSFKNVTDELGAVAKDRLKLLGITDLAQMRPDGHPNKYRAGTLKNLAGSKGKSPPSDCLHWCLPGPIDTWNDLLVHSLRDVIFT